MVSTALYLDFLGHRWLYHMIYLTISYLEGHTSDFFLAQVARNQLPVLLESYF